MKVETWYIDGYGYEGVNPPQDGKGNFTYDEVKVILSRKEYEKLLAQGNLIFEEGKEMK